MSNFIDLSIIVPAYNEALRIPPTLERLHAFLSAQPLRYEIVVVWAHADAAREVLARLQPTA